MSATRYRLPEVLGGGEFEATEWWSGCAGADRQYRIAGTNVTVSVPSQSPLEEVPPPLPEEPPVGSVVLDRNGRVWQCRAGRPGSANKWQSLLGGQEAWEYVFGLEPVRLVPDPFAEPVELPWGDEDLRVSVGAASHAVIVEGIGHRNKFSPGDAREFARALWTAADVIEAKP